MKPRERAIRALMLEEPDRVPMFELEFQYPEEIIGEPYVLSEDQTGWAVTVFRDFLKTDKERIRRGRNLNVTEHNSRVLAETCKKMGYDIIRVGFAPDPLESLRILRKNTEDPYPPAAMIAQIAVKVLESSTDLGFLQAHNLLKYIALKKVKEGKLLYKEVLKTIKEVYYRNPAWYPKIGGKRLSPEEVLTELCNSRLLRIELESKKDNLKEHG